MSRTPRLTDALLREALTPAPDVTAPNGLLATIGADVRRTAQDRPFLTGWLGSLAERWSSQAPARRLAWALVTIGLVLALVAGALVGATRLYEPPTITVSATGIEVLTPESGGYSKVLVDGDGDSWAIGRGHVTRFDPGTGAHRTWTVGDDLAFDSDPRTTIAARLGGLWIAAGGSIRRFDGTGFPESIPLPTTDGQPVTIIIEDPGGALWAGSDTGGPWRWDGSDWVAAPGGRPGDGVGMLVVEGDDGRSTGGFPALWVGDWSAGAASSIGTVSHLSEGRWTSYGWREAPALAGQDVELVPDGETLWVASSMGLARFVDGAWQSVEGPDGADVRSLTIDAEGAIWAIVSGAESRIARLAGGAWTTFQVDGLGRGWLESISTTGAGTFLGTTDGLYRFDDGRAQPVWSDQEVGRSPRWIGSIAAISADEVWATAESSVWHYVDGGWQGPETLGPPDTTWVHSLAAGHDGRVWAVTERGVAVREDGRWTLAWTGQAGEVSLAPDGTAWLGGHGGRLVQLRWDGGAWISRTVRCPVGAWVVTVAADGTVWGGGITWGDKGGVVRYDGQTCEAVDPLGNATNVQAIGLAADQAGGLAAMVAQQPIGGSRSVRVMRSDGSSWSSLTPEVASDAIGFEDLAFGPTGELWLAGFPNGAGGLQRYRDGAWQDVVPGLGVSAVSIAPDGTVWLVGSPGVLRIRPDALPD